MKYQLVLQFDGSSIEDFDELIYLETSLGVALGSEHIVDGHDFGSGEMNIFIHTSQPEKACITARKELEKTNIVDFLAAYRDFESEDYVVIFPKDYKGEFNIV